MKNLLLLLCTTFLLAFAMPQEASAQCNSNPDSNLCLSLPSGSCVCYPSGQLRFWLARDILSQAQSSMAQQFPQNNLRDYLRAYYRSGELSIDYLGGTWADGQSFRVEMGGGNVIVVISDGEL